MADFEERLNSILSDPQAMARIAQLAQSLNAGTPPPPPPPPPADSPPPPADSGVQALLPLLRELGGEQNSNARRLLQALGPYLSKRRQEKVERALQLARMIHLGRTVLARWEG